MSFRNALISFSVWIIWSFSTADLACSCYIEDQENKIIHPFFKGKIKKVKKDKLANKHKHKQEQITNKTNQGEKQPKTSLTQIQHPTTEITRFSQNLEVRCLEELGPKVFYDLLQTDSKSILLNDIKISILEKEVVKELYDFNSSPISAILDTVIQLPPSKNGLKSKGNSATGKYYLYQGELLMDELPIEIQFTRHNLTAERSSVSIERGVD